MSTSGGDPTREGLRPGSLEELEAVTEWIARVDTAKTREQLVRGRIEVVVAKAPQDSRVEAASVLFAASRHRELNMVELH